MSRHGCLPTTFKFTGWIIVLLQLVVFIPVVITIYQVPPETKAYVDDGLYQHKGLINVHSRLYLKQLFCHFEAHFVEKGIGNWHRSRWPQLLQDLDLLPKQYKVTYATQDRRPLSDFWTDWHGDPEREEAPPLNSQVQIPLPLMCLFDGVPGVVRATRTIRYGEVLAAAQDIVDNQYDIYSRDRKTNLKKATIKKYRVLVFFGLTVFDQFLGAVENQTGTPLVTQEPRIRFVTEPVAGDHPQAEQVPLAQVQPRPARLRPRPAGPKVQVPAWKPLQPIGFQILGSMKEPIYGRDLHGWPDQAGGSNREQGVAGPLAQEIDRTGTLDGGFVGRNPIRSASPLAAVDPGQLIGHQILGSMKEPIYGRDLHGWPDQAGGSNREQRVAGPLAQDTDRTGASGSSGVDSNSAAARAPNREAKRKPTDQGGGPSKGGKRGSGGAMRSMDEPRVGHVHKTHYHARKFKSGAKSHRGHGLRA